MLFLHHPHTSQVPDKYRRLYSLSFSVRNKKTRKNTKPKDRMRVPCGNKKQKDVRMWLGAISCDKIKHHKNDDNNSKDYKQYPQDSHSAGVGLHRVTSFHGGPEGTLHVESSQQSSSSTQIWSWATHSLNAGSSS